ncbi:hypothetical protein ES705_17794 [subsurface metagenome]
MYLNNFKISNNFNLKEFECPCCNRVKISKIMIIRLERLRILIGNKPIKITSGYRCKNQNSIVGGVKNSYHKYGLACDIVVKGADPKFLMEYAKRAGFLGIGTYNNYTHLDLRKEIYYW